MCLIDVVFLFVLRDFFKFTVHINNLLKSPLTYQGIATLFSYFKMIKIKSAI